MAGLEAGADDYITKPCQPAELRARLHTGCRILSLEEKLVQAREEMRYKATHDALTAIWNRASILSLVRNELDRSARSRQPTSVLLCDIDHFKRINDNHGHLIGDVVLKEVAARFASAVRSYDAVGRYGGEEFLIVLSNCDSPRLNCAAKVFAPASPLRPCRPIAGICLFQSASGLSLADSGSNTPRLSASSPSPTPRSTAPKPTDAIARARRLSYDRLICLLKR